MLNVQDEERAIASLLAPLDRLKWGLLLTLV